jgi:hypothetical protein
MHLFGKADFYEDDAPSRAWLLIYLRNLIGLPLVLKNLASPCATFYFPETKRRVSFSF